MRARVGSKRQSEAESVSRARPILGPRNDAFEREADQIAESVVSGVSHDATVIPVSRAAAGIQRKCATCEDEMVRGKDAAMSGPVAPRVADGIAQSRGGGRPLSGAERAFFQPRFGHSFADVRIHDDTRAGALSAAIGARAFTIGQDVFVGASQYRAETMSGRKLLAHELVHTLQQAPDHGVIRRQSREGEEQTPPADPCTYPGEAVKEREIHLNLGLDAVRVYTNGGTTQQFDNLITGPSTRRLARSNGWCHMYSVKGHQRHSGHGLINFVNYCGNFGFHSNFWRQNGTIERIPGSQSHGCARLHDADATSTGTGDSDAFYRLVQDGDCVRIYDQGSWRQPTFKRCPSRGETC